MTYSGLESSRGGSNEYNESSKWIDLFYLGGVSCCFRYITTLRSASRNKLSPLAFTDSWFSFDTSQNLPADSCNVSKERSTLLPSQDFTLFIVALRVLHSLEVQALPQKNNLRKSPPNVQLKELMITHGSCCSWLCPAVVVEIILMI